MMKIVFVIRTASQGEIFAMMILIFKTDYPPVVVVVVGFGDDGYDDEEDCVCGQDGSSR